MEIWPVHIDELREQDVNARSQPKAMFDRLAATIRRDKRLEALPLIAVTDLGLEIVSGHHRVRASRAAELTEIYALVDTSGLTSDQIKAKQLAHNAIQGSDDPQLLARIYQSIEDVEARLETFIDSSEVEMDLPKVKLDGLTLGMEYRTALITFLPYELEMFERALKAVEVHLSADYKVTYLAELALLERWKQMLRRVGKEYDIRAIGTIVARIATIVLEALGEEVEEDAVPRRDLFGMSAIPNSAAQVIRQAIDKALQAGDVTPPQSLAAARVAGGGLSGRPLMVAPGEPWDRMPKETAKAYAAFCAYRDMPPAKRSLGSWQNS